MIDTSDIKSKINCVELVEQDLGVQGKRFGAWVMFCCPFHVDGSPSLGVKPDGWHCFGCGAHGDAITWLQLRQGVSFGQACQALSSSSYSSTVRAAPRPPIPCSTAPDEIWQQAAALIVEESAWLLWQPGGRRALDYLRVERHLQEDTIREAQLGYVPGSPDKWRKLHGLNVPCGVLIPWVADGAIWALKVRRAGGPVRYQQAAGGQLSRALYWADHLVTKWPALIIEGEFNCLVAWQEGMDLLTPVSMGSASGRLDLRWLGHLAGVAPLMVCFDDDPAGQAGAAKLLTFSRRAQLVKMPEGYKDLNDLLKLGGWRAVRDWFDCILERVEAAS